MANMLSSTKEYFDALQQGNYLRFLEWPEFITNNCPAGKEPPGSDKLLNSLTREWLQHGFEATADQFLLLYAVNDTYDFFSGELHFNLTILLSAFCTCMAYSDNSLLLPSGDEKISRAKISLKSVEKDAVAAKREEFANRLHVFKMEQKEKIVVIAEKIEPLCDIYCLVIEYLEEFRNKEDAQSYSTHSPIIKGMNDTIKDTAALTQEAKEKLFEYIVIIRGRKPAEFEEFFLNELIAIIKSNQKMGVLPYIRYIGMGIFNTLYRGNPAIPALTDETTEAAENKCK